MRAPSLRAPKPEVFSSPGDRKYLECVASAAGNLEQVLLAEQQPQERDRLVQRLGEKHGFLFAASGQCTGSHDDLPDTGQGTCFVPNIQQSSQRQDEEAVNTARHEVIDKPAKALRSLVMRFPDASAGVLRKYRFSWTEVGAPLRAGPSGPKEIDLALKEWTDKTSTAADSSLFSSLGVWISPFTLPMVFTAAVIFLIVAVTNVIGDQGSSPVIYFPFYFMQGLCNAFGCSTTAFLLYRNNRPLAMRCWSLGLFSAFLCSEVEAASAVCKCWGPYAEKHAPVGNKATDAVLDYPAAYAANCALFGVSYLPLAMLATHADRSFGLLFVAMPIWQLLAAVPYVFDYAQFSSRVGMQSFIASTIIAVGVFMRRRRARALEHALELDAKDTARYTTLWQEMLAQPRFAEELRELRRAWGDVQASAAHDNSEVAVPRQQSKRKGVGWLFREADQLNDPMHAKLHSLCEEHGGAFLRSDVKAESRSLQKVFRTYGERWWRLSDLCRSSLVFDTIPQMAACLRAIGNDPEVVVVPAANEAKMRLRKDFDAAKLTGGYRDVQLTVLLDTPETRALGVHQHLAEVQLHLTSILQLKSVEGHDSYVLRRNLRGN
jgi:hypothetical protein